ncbi:MAG: DUF1974 domain-containing protein, partial [Rhodobacteraceae bacterium]|nr:DUF1974 domain-containing protein [Paracoccaceae bacterium]
AIRCHPFVYKEMLAAREPDNEVGLTAFDDVIWKHLGHQLSSAGRALWHNATGALTAHAPRAGRATGLYRKLMRASVNFAVAAEAAMVLLGGNLKRRESISARLGDVLSNLYLLSACLKRYADDGRPDEDWPVLAWCGATTLKAADDALAGVLANLTPRPFAWVLRPFVRPWWGGGHGPTDRESGACADVLLAPSPTRDRLTDGIYIGDENQPAGKLDAALGAVIAADAIQGRLKGKDFTDAKAAHAAGAITTDELATIELAQRLTHSVIMVDDFAPEELSPLWNRQRAGAL